MRLGLLRAGIAALIAIATMPAMARDFDASGRWKTTSGESAYAISYCGDGTALCGKLVWLSKDPHNDKAKRYLGQTVVNQARPVGPNEWRGQMHVLGLSIGGTILLTSDKAMTLRGCFFYLFCKTFHLVKVSD